MNAHMATFTLCGLLAAIGVAVIAREVWWAIRMARVARELRRWW